VSPHHGRLTVMEGAKSSQPRLVCRLACIFAMALMVSRSSAALLLATARLVGVSTALVPRPTLSVLSTSCAVKKRALSFEISNINMPSTRGQLHRVSLETTTATVRRSTRRTLVVTAASSDSTEEPGSTVASTPRIKRIKKEETVTTTTTVKVDAVVCSTPDLQNTPKSATKRKTKSGPEPSSRSPPPDFESIYSLVEELRADRTAPVDHSGSEALPEKHRGDVVFRFQVLIALMLSSQTKDGVVGDTMRTLQQHGLDLDSILATSHEDLNSMIGKVGFHNNKTKYIKQTAEILKRDYGGDIPPDASEIMKLPGVSDGRSDVLVCNKKRLCLIRLNFSLACNRLDQRWHSSLKM
jgi:hypothetical protein